MVTNVITMGTLIVNVYFAGHLGDAQALAAVGLTNTLLAMMCLCLILGLNSAQETLTSQAYGASNYRLCGIYLNRGTFILLSFFIPYALGPFLFGSQIFRNLG